METATAPWVSAAKAGKEVRLNVRLPVQLHRALRQYADRQDRSLNWAILRACEAYMRRRPAADSGGADALSDEAVA
jgi:predicted transcriptional regulator